MPWLSIAWECHDEGEKVRGRLWLRPDGADSPLLFDLDAKKPTFTFDLGRNVRGRLWFSLGREATLNGDLQLSISEVFEGPIAVWPTAAPPLPVSDEADDDGVVLENPLAGHDICPFLVTSRLPSSGIVAASRRVVRCPDVTTLPLYVTLAPLRDEVRTVG